jgi:hypothetical protein
LHSGASDAEGDQQNQAKTFHVALPGKSCGQVTANPAAAQSIHGGPRTREKADPRGLCSPVEADVMRWIEGGAADGFVRRLLAALD